MQPRFRVWLIEEEILVKETTWVVHVIDSVGFNLGHLARQATRFNLSNKSGKPVSQKILLMTSRSSDLWQADPSWVSTCLALVLPLRVSHHRSTEFQTQNKWKNKNKIKVKISQAAYLGCATTMVLITGAPITLDRSHLASTGSKSFSQIQNALATSTSPRTQKASCHSSLLLSFRHSAR